jgi:hypothetical protein
MKRILFTVAFLSVTCGCFSQIGFGLDGTLGVGFNDKETVNPILLEGRVQWNNYFSTNIGIGLWNSGYKDSWKDEGSSTLNLYHLNDNKALPTLQVSLRGQAPILKIGNKTIKIFVEPTLYFLPFSARTTTLEYKHFTATSGTSEYDFTDGSKFWKYDQTNSGSISLESDNSPHLYYGIQGGLSMNIYKDFDFCLGYGYTNIDLFRSLRGQTIGVANLNDHLPKEGMTLFSVSLRYNYRLN